MLVLHQWVTNMVEQMVLTYLLMMLTRLSEYNQRVMLYLVMMIGLVSVIQLILK